MSTSELPERLTGLAIHLVGAKGTGMAALAEILAARGARLSGSDVADTFYTDSILAGLGVRMSVGFEAGHLPLDAAMVIHSAAYRRDQNPELLEAERRGLPILVYPEALGALSTHRDSSGIAGVHGKTTTTAMAGSVAKALGLPATILAGSAVGSFGGRSTLMAGDRYFIAETCEYRRHFLHFSPGRIVLTSVESDHQDYYPTYADILTAFIEYGRRLSSGGELIYCADDPGAVEVADALAKERADIVMTPYGKSATGPWRLEWYRAGKGLASFKLEGLPGEFALRVPGEHLALDATAAVALGLSLLRTERGCPSELPPDQVLAATDLESLRAGLLSFSGSKRRAEILGEAGGVLFMDDYGHHPTAIRETIRGIKAFWPDRRLVVDFMSHTYSRTSALFGDFVASLDGADKVVLHRIYASARETADPSLSGRTLFEAVARRRRSLGRDEADDMRYYEDILDGEGELSGWLQEGDLFLTMGAGDNWKLGKALLEGRGLPGKEKR